MRQINRGPLFILAAAMLFGTTGTVRALMPEGMSPALTGALRLAVGGPLLLALTAVGKQTRSARYRMPWRATLLAAAGVGLFQVCFFSAVVRTGVAVGTIVAIGSAPLAAGLIEAAFFHETLTPRWLAAALMSIGGGSLLVASGHELTLELSGILLAVGSGLGYAVYQVACQRLVRGRSPERVTAVVLCLGALLLAPFLASPGAHLVRTPRGLVTVLFLGVIATAAAYALFARGLQTTPVSRAAVLALAEPLTACLLGVFFLGEALSGQAWLGAALVVGGLVLVTGGGPPPVRKRDPQTGGLL